MIAFICAAIGAFALTGCGTARLVRPEKIALEPTIVSCSPGTRPAECTSGNLLLLRRAREARSHRCPQDKPNVLVKSDGTLLCVAGFPAAAPSAINLSPPSDVRAGGSAAVGEFDAGRTVAARSGCLACHRIAQAGNDGPGPDLTQVGSRLVSRAIERTLVAAQPPMPSFSGLPPAQRRALVYFLAHLR